MSMLFLRCSRQ